MTKFQLAANMEKKNHQILTNRQLLLTLISRTVCLLGKMTLTSTTRWFPKQSPSIDRRIKLLTNREEIMEGITIRDTMGE